MEWKKAKAGVVSRSRLEKIKVWVMTGSTPMEKANRLRTKLDWWLNHNKRKWWNPKQHDQVPSWNDPSSIYYNHFLFVEYGYIFSFHIFDPRIICTSTIPTTILQLCLPKPISKWWVIIFIIAWLLYISRINKSHILVPTPTGRPTSWPNSKYWDLLYFILSWLLFWPITRPTCNYLESPHHLFP